METLELFRFTSNSDTTEGRGYTIVHGYTRDQNLAKAIVSDKRYSRYCVMGVQQPDDYKYMTGKSLITIYESVDEYFHSTPEEIKKRALAKLTPQERQVLGY